MRVSLLVVAAAVLIPVTACNRGARETAGAVGTSGAVTTSAGTSTSVAQTPSAEPAATPTGPPPGTPVQAEFRNVDLHLDADTIMHIAALRGELVSLKRGMPPIFDDRDSFVVKIDSAEMRMDAASLSRLMNRFVLGYQGAPLKDLEAGVEPDPKHDKFVMTMKGKVHKGVDLPFAMKAEVGVTPEGQIRMHTTSFKAAKVPAKKLLDLFGVELDDLVKLRQDRGMQMVDDDVLLDPEKLLPPPAIKGKVVDARVAADGLHLTFGGPTAKTPRLPLPLKSARNFMYYRGGVLRFGKLTMTDADLLLLDDDQRDVFDFFQERYNDQLVAGYSKNTRNKGLITHMVDFAKVARGR